MFLSHIAINFYSCLPNLKIQIMVTHEHNLKFQKLFIEQLLLNISIFFLLYIPVNGELNNHHDATLYFLQGNLSWIFTLFILTNPAFLIRFGLFTQIRIITKRMIFFFISLNIFVYLSIPYKYSFLFLVEFTILFYAAQIIFLIIPGYIEPPFQRKLNQMLNDGSVIRR